MSVALPDGFEGIILTGGQAFEQRLAIGFEGIVLTYSDRAVFIRVVNGLGRPVPGVTVSMVNSADTRIGITDLDGKTILEADDTASIILEKDKAFRNLTYTRSTDGATLDIIFQPPLLH